MIEDADADILEGILQKTDLSNGLAPDFDTCKLILDIYPLKPL